MSEIRKRIPVTSYYSILPRPGSAAPAPGEKKTGRPACPRPALGVGTDRFICRQPSASPVFGPFVHGRLAAADS